MRRRWPARTASPSALESVHSMRWTVTLPRPWASWWSDADVGPAEVVEADGAEGGDEVVVHVPAVVGGGGGLQLGLLGVEPVVEVVGDALIGVAGDAAMRPPG